MANPSVLTPIGFDTPQLQYSVTPQVAQSLQADMTPDMTGVSIMQEASKSFMQTNQSQIQSSQIQTQALDNINKAQVASAQAIGQAESLNFQANAASGANSVKAWAGLFENVGGLVDKATKQAEARRVAEMKAELDRNQITSTTELENLQVDWIEKGRLTREGSSAYRRAVGEILAKRPLQADTISSLTTKYYAPALDHAKQQDKLVYDNARKATEYNRDILSKQVRIELTTVTAGLEQSGLGGGGEDAAAPFRDKVVNKIREIYDRKDLDDLTKAQIVSEALDPALKSESVLASTKAILGREQAGAAAVANYIAEKAPLVRSGEMAQTTFDAEANEVRLTFGLPVKDTTSPDTDLQRTLTNLQTSQTLEDLNKKAIISDAEKVEYDNLYVSSIGVQAYLNPALLSTMDPSDPKLDKNAKGGIQLAKDANKFYGETTLRYRQERENAQKTLAEMQKADFAKAISLINQAGQDNTSNSLAASLRGLGLGMPPSPPGQTGVTQEQLDFMEVNSLAVRQALVDSIGPNSASTIAYNAELQKFQSLGFYEDKRQSQTYLKQIEAKTVEYNQRLEEMRTKRITNLTPPTPGQSPNFNGGSLGVQAPLTRRSFRGISNVVMPFPIGAANQMSDAPAASGAMWGGAFGDGRPGRQHDGVDFPVPTGTPTLSLVYGTVTEVRTWDGKSTGYGNAVAVKGDDGREYFFAHLDSVGVTVGQRVGTGEKLGLSGDSGAPGGEHLHMEILVDGKVTDPLAILSTMQLATNQQPKQPRSAGPMTGVEKGVAEIDPRAIPMGGGKFLIDGKVISYSPDFSQSRALKSGVDIMSLQEYDVDLGIHNIKVAPGLGVIGYTPTMEVRDDTPEGTPVGYYTLRNKNGGVLTQTAFKKKGTKEQSIKVGFDGKGYVAPPRIQSPPPSQPTKVDASKAGRVLIQQTGQKDEFGLDILSVTMFDQKGKNVGSYRVNSGKPEKQGTDTSVVGTGAPIPFGSYDVGTPEAADDIPGMRSDFIPITPRFKTQRSLLGIHFDGDRKTDPGSMGCVVFKSKAEFDTFKAALTSSQISRLDFEKGGIKIVAPNETQSVVVPNKVRANKEGQRMSSYLDNPNVVAFLDAMARAEGTYDQPGGGYTTGFGFKKIQSLADHPYSGSELTPQKTSTASGRFQFMGHTWGDMKRALGLQDFSPLSQQIAAVKQLDQKGILESIAKGDINDKVLYNAAGIWASVESAPGSGVSAYGGNVVTPGGSYAAIRSFWEERRKAKQQSQPQRTGGYRPSITEPQAPPPDYNKIPIGGGKFLLKGKIVSADYTTERPMQQSYASASKFDYDKEDTTGDFYGYAQLQRQPKTFEAVNRVANETKLPPQWIADVAALNGTSGIEGPEELEFIASKLRGKTIHTPTDLVAAVMGNGEYVKDLGVHTGRRYDSQFSRFARTTARTHTKLVADCRMCGQLQAQSSFVPHRGELA